MQRGVLVCALLLACHSRQGDSSASTERTAPATNVPKRSPNPDPGTPVLHANNSTFIAPSRQTIFTSLYSTTPPSTHSPANPLPNNSPKNAKHTGGATLPTSFYPSSSLLPAKDDLPLALPVKAYLASSEAPTRLPSSAPTPSSQNSTLSSTFFSFLTFSTSNDSLESSTRVTSVYFDKPQFSNSSASSDRSRDRTFFSAASQVVKKLKLVNRVKSVSPVSTSKSAHQFANHSSNNGSASQGTVLSSSTVESYKNLVHPTKVSPTSGNSNPMRDEKSASNLKSYNNLVHPTKTSPTIDDSNPMRDEKSVSNLKSYNNLVHPTSGAQNLRSKTTSRLSPTNGKLEGSSYPTSNEHLIHPNSKSLINNQNLKLDIPSNNSRPVRVKEEGLFTLENYKNLVHPTKIVSSNDTRYLNSLPVSIHDASTVRNVHSSSMGNNEYRIQKSRFGLVNVTQNLRPVSTSNVITSNGKKLLPLRVNQVENLRLSLGDTSEIRVASDVITGRMGSVRVGGDVARDQMTSLYSGSDVIRDRLSSGHTGSGVITDRLSSVHSGSDVITDRLSSNHGGAINSDRMSTVRSKSSVITDRLSSVHSGSGVSGDLDALHSGSDVATSALVRSDVINLNLSLSTVKNSEVMSPPPSHVDVSKHTSPIADVSEEERRPNRTEKSWKTPSVGGDLSETAHGPRDDYYEYSEYSDFPMKHFNVSGLREAAVIPDPDLRDDEAADPVVESEPETEIILPDDSLADTDLHDHDLIDSVMYIYFGGSPENGRGAGRQVLIVGAVIGLVAQFLTLASAVQRVRSFPREETTVILLHTQLAFTVSNLVFMLGVQATSIAGQCARVALSLHYLHMTAGVWLLINCAHVCLRISVKLRHAIAAWALPLFHVLGCYMLNRRIYETRNFCWMSIHRGLLLSFVAPAFIFLTLNTTLGAIGYTRSKFQCQQSPSVDRKALRVAVVLLPAFIFDWFVEIVALEKSSALVFPLLFVASKAFINWFIFACWLPSDQSWQDIDDEYDDDVFDDFEDDIPPSLMKLKYMVEDQQHKGMDDYRLPYYPNYGGYPSDDLPLLHEASETYKCGRRDVCDLQMDPISTICS